MGSAAAGKRVWRARHLTTLAGVFAIALVLLLLPQRSGGERVSSFGRYAGFSEARYNGNHRISEYLTLADGTRLAYDLILPTRDGVVATGRLPVLFKYTPYLRTFTIFDAEGHDKISDLYQLAWWERALLRLRYWTSERGHLLDPVFRTKWLDRMLRHGYAVIVVERSGTGASAGWPDLSHDFATREAGQILDWIAAQPWCNGRIGMYGESFQAMVQFAAAAAGNPHLKAIFPASSSFDGYQTTFPGGIYNEAFQSLFTWAMAFLERVVTPVDSDPEGHELARLLEWRRGHTISEQSVRFRDFPFRDSTTSAGVEIWKGPGAVYPLLDRVNRANVPAYLTVGWYDLFSADAFLLFNALTVPRRLTVRPIDHSEADESGADLDYAAEAHRWFDHWLKGIDNGIMVEPPIHYYVIGERKERAWRVADRWPLREEQALTRHFSEGRSGTIASSNDGLLSAEAPPAAAAADEYTADYTTTSGKKSRWSAINWRADHPDMRANDAKALTYTSEPLPRDLELTGHPVVQLWLSSAAADLDLFVYLEDVRRDGQSRYVTEGMLRASHRRPGRAPYNNLGLPYHSFQRVDAAPLAAGEPQELAFALLPSAYRWREGHRIRVSIALADVDNFATPRLDPPPRMRVLRQGAHASRIVLPLRGN